MFELENSLRQRIRFSFELRSSSDLFEFADAAILVCNFGRTESIIPSKRQL